MKYLPLQHPILLAVILYNINGFWNSTIAMLDDLQQQGMVRGLWRDYICVADNLDEIAAILTQG